ncbi:hypothetical protein BRADI_3g48815v3 [Brachypodium distachyon]|uniref:Uncharacterized protein n=1 Tax=Brachypodium distachyon TaxID=15368 RepID=A0A2K2D464_BRADI|nr:hypothetical protein BRADI_3g48815v3 [Brachypodium distachyon]
MDRPQRKNPSSGPLKPPRPPRGTAFQPPPASRPRPDPSSPDGRPIKKVRFESKAGSHREYARQDSNTSRAEKTKAQDAGSDAKTTEFKFFKKLWEQSGCRSRSFRQPHQNIVPDIYKQKEGNRIESHNVTSHKKFPVHKVTLCSVEAPATPANNKISDEQVKVQASHSEYDNHDTPQLKPCDSLPTVQVFTPMIKTPFELAGISRNTDIEHGSGRMFSDKRRILLKLAAKTVSMESCELFQRRSEFFADILQRLGADNIIRKKDPMRKRNMVCRNTPAHQDLPSFLDWRNGLPCGDNEAHDCMPVRSAHTIDLASFDMKRQTVHNQVSNWLLEDVQPHSRVKPISANELGCIIRTGSYDHHGWDPMLSETFAESIPDRMFLPCQTVEQSLVPHEVSNTFWQPELCSSLERCTSRSVRLEGGDSVEAGLFDNSDAGLLSRFGQLHAKCTSSSFLGPKDGILDHNSFSDTYNFHVSDRNNILLDTNRSCLNSICSTSDYPSELRPKSFSDSAVRMSCFAETEEKYSSEAELFDF